MERKTFKESYQVKLNFKMPDGYWKIGHIIEVQVSVEHGVKEQQNHAEAERIAKARYPGCEIVSVIYA
jgi:hypothetical protein